MFVIHLARKPLAESTILGNVGTLSAGALNIDSSRMPCGTDHLRATVTSRGQEGMSPGDARKGAALGMFQPGKGFQPTNHPGGRWPSNVIFLCTPPKPYFMEFTS